MSLNLFYRLADSVGMALKVESGGFVTGAKNINCGHVLDGLSIYQTVVSSALTDKISTVVLTVGNLVVCVGVGLSTKNEAYMLVIDMPYTKASNILEKHNVKEWQDVLRVFKDCTKAVYLHRQGRWVIPE